MRIPRSLSQKPKKARFTSNFTLKLWNDLTIKWNDLTWNKLTMERSDRKIVSLFSVQQKR